jgi:hypothetical protein
VFPKRSIITPELITDDENLVENIKVHPAVKWVAQQGMKDS